MAEQVVHDDNDIIPFNGIVINTERSGRLVGAFCIERVGVAYADNFALAYMSADFSPVVVLI